ncbi:alpha/beta hydrolase [Tundrisphaera sp. TA3]|uniref:alpha/beta hydrolase n=1 Tax=Tundrisphaera sp. TA3 TaxID=3435775 RepID=UPI003EBB75BF
MAMPRRPGKRRLIRAGAALTLLAVLGYGAISLLAADVLTRTRNRHSSFAAAQIGAGTREWSTRTADGITLRGWYCPTDIHRRLIVLVHGMGGSRDNMANLASDLRARGYDVLLFDLRGHGESDPSRLFMGRREREDIRAVQAWATRAGYPADRIGWLGQSMGASTLLMEAARNEGIRVAVLDSPFGNLPELLRDQLTRHSHLPRLFNPGILLAARVAFGVRTDDLIPLISARRWGGRPMLLIHGEADTIVPVAQARQIARVAGTSCETIMLPGVPHVGAYRRDPARYVAAVGRFFDHNLKH